MINHIIFEKSYNALFFCLIICDFFSKYNKTGVFNQSEIGNEYDGSFQNKM